MKDSVGFSLDTVRRANLDMIMGIKPEPIISDKFTLGDIKRAWKEASMKVFGEGTEE